MRDDREHSPSVQRVKVGMIGLAIVVLLIGLASAVMRTATREAPIAAVGAPKAEVIANLALTNVQQDVGEPLAELGVTPIAGNSQGALPHGGR